MDIKEKIKAFPDSPGVYLMKDRAGTILYAGKASSLRKRVNSYFQKSPIAKIQALLERVEDIDYVQTSSSAQALLLENSLIKKYRPYYNAALKDDKSYPYVKINTKEKFPRVSVERGKQEKGVRYYGPYTNVKLLKAAVKSIRAIFPFRSCARLPKKPCLYLHLRLCPGMCVKKVTPLAYRENLKALEMFLQGRYRQLLKSLSGKMQEAAEKELFEEAGALRDRVGSLSEIIAQTKEPDHPECRVSRRVSSGCRRITSKKNSIRHQDLILALQKVLRLKKPPYRIEAFDISEIGGEGLSGSVVSFLGGWPDKNNYRKFRIKTVKGIDDYAMICEVLRRRYGKVKDQARWPDLVMIDGGKGHLSCAQRQLRSLGLAKVPVISLAKRLETIYTPKGVALNLSRQSKVLHLLQRIRDEAHRFALFYHRKLREKTMRLSSLDGIAGIGAKRKKALLRHFKSIRAITKASAEDLLKVKTIDKKTAKSLIRFFRA